MTEAVIVATARTPIGRAFKGSLEGLRPDDLSAQVVRRRAREAARASTRRRSTTSTGAAPTRAASTGLNLARVIAVLAGMDHLPAATVNRFCASSTQTIRMAFHAIKAGEGDTFLVGRRRVRLAVHGFGGAGGSDADDPEPPVRGCRGAHCRDGAHRTTTWTDPREDGLLPDVYIAMGQTAENVATSRGVSPRATGRVRRP